MFSEEQQQLQQQQHHQKHQQQQQQQAPAFNNEGEPSYARFPLSRPMSPPVRSKYVTSPPPRANSTPPANHHLNNSQQRRIEDYEYTQLMMDKVFNKEKKIEIITLLLIISSLFFFRSPFFLLHTLSLYILYSLISSKKMVCQREIYSKGIINGWIVSKTQTIRV